MTETIAFPIDGMTCTSCVSRITRALRRVDGVVAARVDLGSDSATVTYESERTSAELIGAAVSDAGYEPRLAEVRAVSGPAASVALRRPPIRLLVAVAGLAVLGLLIAGGVPLGSLVPFVAMAGCLGMHLFMGHGERGH